MKNRAISAIAVLFSSTFLPLFMPAAEAADQFQKGDEICVRHIIGWSKLERIAVQISTQDKTVLDAFLEKAIGDASVDTPFQRGRLPVSRFTQQVGLLREAVERAASDSLLIDRLVELKESRKLEPSALDAFAHIAFSRRSFPLAAKAVKASKHTVYELYSDVAKALVESEPSPARREAICRELAGLFGPFNKYARFPTDAKHDGTLTLHQRFENWLKVPNPESP